jgi:hypothetical protein
VVRQVGSKLKIMQDDKEPPQNRTGADLIAALQSSPHRDTEIEPERYRVLNPLPPSLLDWLKQQRLRVAEVFRLFSS